MSYETYTPRAKIRKGTAKHMLSLVWDNTRSLEAMRAANAKLAKPKKDVSLVRWEGWWVIEESRRAS